MRNLRLLLLKLPAIWLAVTAPAAVLAAETESEEGGSWVALKGRVTAQADDNFKLDLGDGEVTVEADDWDTYEEGALVMKGDVVTVYGRVDEDFYGERTIEADSIYLEELETLITDSSSADEEEFAPAMFSYYDGPGDYEFQLTGTVTSISGGEFTLDSGARRIEVDTARMSENPLDAEGRRKIDVGDLVKVSGRLEASIFEKREVMAERIVTLNQSSETAQR